MQRLFLRSTPIIPLNSTSLYNLLRRAATIFADRPYINDVSYTLFQNIVDKYRGDVRGLLYNKSRQQQPIFVVRGRKSVQWAAAAFAVWAENGIFVPWHPVVSMLHPYHLVEISPENNDLVVLHRPTSENTNIRIPGQGNVAIILATSGTSNNKSKLVPLTHSNVCSNIDAMQPFADKYNVGSEDQFVSVLPWNHSYALTCELLFAMTRGASICIPPHLTSIRNSSPTLICGVPKVFDKIRETVLHKRIPTFIPSNILRWLITGGRLRLATCAGAPLAPATADFIQGRLGVPLLEGYGLTETSPLVTFCGTPVACNEVQLSKDNSGILVHGKNVFSGYVSKTEDDTTSSNVFVDVNGKQYFQTGDRGSWCPDTGVLKIIGRTSELYKLSNGKFIDPAYIEQLLSSDHRVLQAFVYPDLKSNAFNRAVVHVVSDVDNPSVVEGELRDRLKDVLQHYEIPPVIKIFKTSPFPESLYTVKGTIKRNMAKAFFSNNEKIEVDTH